MVKLIDHLRGALCEAPAMRVWVPFLSVFALLGCGATTPSTPATTPAAAGVPPHEQLPPSPDAHVTPDRELGSNVTFSTVVAAARALDDSGAGPSEEHCLLRGGTDTSPRMRLAAEVVVGVRPLPDPSIDFDEALARDGLPVRILTRWGDIGPAVHGFVLTTFTDLPPPREGHPPIVVFLTDRGITLRTTALRSSTLSAGTHLGTELGLDDFARYVRSTDTETSFVVTAEAETSYARLRALLGVLNEAHRHVALGVPLAPTTRLPQQQPLTTLEERRGLCPEGLPPLADTVIEGTVNADQVRTRLREVQQTALVCMQRARSTDALDGGLYRITFRIGGDGRVTDACALTDEIADANVRLCVLEAVRALAFTPPTPPGPADVAIPLRFSPSYGTPNTALCD